MNKIRSQIKNLLGNYFVFPFLILIFLASSYYLLQNGFFYVHDYPMGARTIEAANAIKDFHFPIRWSQNFAYGFGMPIFNFYAPLPYLFSGVLYLLGFNLINSLKLLYLAINLLTLLSAFRLGKKIAGNFSGLVLAALFTLAPYRALNLFVRGALSEIFAISFFPLVFLSIENYREKKEPKSLLWLILALMSIVLSHNLTALIFVPLAFFYALFRLEKKLLLRVLTSFILAFGATSFYILPTFLEKDLTQVSSIFSGYFDYRNHFLYLRQFLQNNWGFGGSTWGPNDDISFFLGYAQLLALLTSCFIFIKSLIDWFKTKTATNKALMVSLILTVLALFFSTTRSQFLWEKIPLLNYLQFPWRWLGSASFLLALSFSFALQSFQDKLLRISFSILLVLVSFLNLTFFRAEKIIDHPEKYYPEDIEKISQNISPTLPDYLPRQMASEKILAEYNLLYPKANFWLDEPEQLISAQLLNAKTQSQTWFLNLRNDSWLNFKISNFSGWQVKIDDQLVDHQSNPNLGNIQVLVPQGEHQLELKFKENKLRLVANYLSLLSLFIIVIYYLQLNRKPSNH